MKWSISVLVLYNAPAPTGRFAESEAGVLDEVAAVTGALEKLRIPYRSVSVRLLRDVPLVLAGADETVVFNLVEGFVRCPEQANLVPAVVRSFGKACTGNDTPGLVLSADKWQSKAVLSAADVPTPQGAVVPPGEAIHAADLFAGPYIVKPIRADASEGIDKTSVVPRAGRKLQEAVRRIHEQLGQAAVVEQFIEGRELNISVVWRSGGPAVLPLAEIDFSAFDATRPRIVGYEAKWLADTFEYQNTPRIIPARVPARLGARIRRLAVSACEVLGCADYCRVDFRLDKIGNPYVLEVNANPDISPEGGFAAALTVAGIGFPQFVKMMIRNAASRIQGSEIGIHDSTAKTQSSKLKTQDSELYIRWCRTGDREAVVKFLSETQFFRPDEIEVAKEVLDSALAAGSTGHYQSYVAEAAGEPVGWVCFGPAPCTLGSFDIYWLVVAPAWQRRGVGKVLMAFAERQIIERGGRLAVVETSSRKLYDPTRAFYDRLGYAEAAVVRDFYAPADHKAIMTKTLG